MRDQLRQFYLGEGFRLFGRAYSKYVNTEASIPAFLNWPVADPHTVRDEPIPDQRYVIKSNDVFRKLSAAGYRIRVYQTTYMDFCDPRAYAIRSCETRPGNSVRNLSLHHLPLWQQMRIVGLYYLEYDSHFYRLLRGLYQHVAGLHPAWPQWTARIRHSEAPAALELLDRLQADLRTDDPRGTLYFAHVLIPHNPYEFDAACRSLSHPNLWVEISRTNTPAERALKYDLYAGQVGCLYRHLAGLLQTVDSMPLGRQMVVIFQGDHGSRIVSLYPEPGALNLDPQNVADAFSALFAIRAPGIAPGYDREFVPIDELVGYALASGFTSVAAPEPEPHVVRIENDPNWITVRLNDTTFAIAGPGDRAPAQGRTTR